MVHRESDHPDQGPPTECVFFPVGGPSCSQQGRILLVTAARRRTLNFSRRAFSCAIKAPKFLEKYCGQTIDEKAFDLSGSRVVVTWRAENEEDLREAGAQ
jgi:hypothetical protein